MLSDIREAEMRRDGPGSPALSAFLGGGLAFTGNPGLQREDRKCVRRGSFLRKRRTHCISRIEPSVLLRPLSPEHTLGGAPWTWRIPRAQAA